MKIILSFTFFQDLSSDRPLWVPYKYKQLNNEITKSHQGKSFKNKYGFNDENHSYVKEDKNQIRIAVLGDSFIWGAGIPDSVIWTSKAEKVVSQQRL